MKTQNYENSPYRLESSPIIDMLERVENETGFPVTVVWGAGQSEDRIEEISERSEIIVYDWATPSLDTSPKVLSHLWDQNGKKFSFQYDGNFLPPSDEDHKNVFKNGAPEGSADHGNDYPYCEIDYLTVWSLVQLSNFNYQSSDLCKSLFNEPIMKMLKRATFTKQKKDYRALTQQRIVKALEDRSEKVLKTSRDAITNVESALSETEDQASRYRKQLEDERIKMEAKEQLASRTKEDHEKQIEALLNHEQITGVKVVRNRLEVTTQDLWLYSPGETERAPLGRWRITLGLDNNSIRCHNMTRELGGRFHPHISSSGAPCWGAMASPVAKLAASGQFVELINMILMYLEKYSPSDDYGKFAQYWFKDPKLIEYRQEDGTYATKVEQRKTKKKEEKDSTVSETISESALEV